MAERENEIILGVKELLISHLAPSRIILFGSRAKKNNYHGSDFDFAIDLDAKPDNDKLYLLKDQIDKIAGLYKVDIVFLIDVDKDFRKIILDTGKVIYEKGS
jgi:uncharacterized protein